MKSLIKYISHVKDLHSLNKYLNEKLLINKNFILDDKINIPKSTHITGEESYDIVIRTIKHNAKDYADKVDKIFNNIHCDGIKYCFYDRVNDEEDDYKKGIGKMFPKGLRNYKPAEYVNFDLSDDECPDDWDDYNSLAKFETEDGNYIIVWTAIDKRLETIYAFICK